MNNYLSLTDRTRAVSRSMGHTFYRRSSLNSLTMAAPPEEVLGDEQVEDLLPMLPVIAHQEVQQNGNIFQDEQEMWRDTGRQLREIADTFRINNSGRAHFPQLFGTNLGDILNSRNLRQIYDAAFEGAQVTHDRILVYTVFLVDLGINALAQGQILNFLMTFAAHSSEIFFQRQGGWFGLMQYGLLALANKSTGSISIAVRALYFASVFFRSNTI